MNINIKKATLENLPDLIGLRRDFCTEDKHDFDEAGTKRIFSEIIKNPTIGEIYIAKSGNKAAGYCFFAMTYSIEFNGKDAWLDELFIDKDHRKSGIGSMFIDLVKNRVVELGGSYLHLECMDENINAQPYYEKRGLKKRKSRHYVMPLIAGLPSTVD